MNEGPPTCSQAVFFPFYNSTFVQEEPLIVIHLSSQQLNTVGLRTLEEPKQYCEPSVIIL